MRILFIGGTGVISTASTALAAKRGMDVTLLSRGQHASELPAGVKTLIADVNDPAILQKLEHESFDAVVDWIADYYSKIVGRHVKGFFFGQRCSSASF